MSCTFNPLLQKKLPDIAGVYHCKVNGEPMELDVYEYKTRGLCVWCEDYGAMDPEFYQDGHIPVCETGIEFIELIRTF